MDNLKYLKMSMVQTLDLFSGLKDEKLMDMRLTELHSALQESCFQRAPDK